MKKTSFKYLTNLFCHAIMAISYQIALQCKSNSEGCSMRKCRILRLGDRFVVSFYNSHATRSLRKETSGDARDLSPLTERSLAFPRKERRGDVVSPPLGGCGGGDIAPVLSSRDSVLRSKKSIECFFRSNDWKYFVTLTVSPQIVHDRSNYNAVIQRLHSVTNRLKMADSSFRFLLVPDFHKDGSLHFHGFVMCSDELLKAGGTYKVLKAGAKRRFFYSPLLYRLFGINEFRPLMKAFGDSMLKYTLKYVSKAADDFRGFFPNCPLYFHSRGLFRFNSVEVYEGDDAVLLEEIYVGLGFKRFDYDHDVKVFSWLTEEQVQKAFGCFFNTLWLQSKPVKLEKSCRAEQLSLFG